MKKLAGIVAVFAAFTMMFGIASCNTNADEPKDQKKSYVGTKTPKEAKAVGDIVFNDGSATPYTEDMILTDDQKAAAIAIIFYAGTDTDPLGAKTLGVGLHNSQGDSTKNMMWAIESAEGYNIEIENIISHSSKNGINATLDSTFTGDTDGSDNWSELCKVVSDETTSGNYPAWEWINAYPKTDSLSGDWYMPTVAEFSMMCRVKETINLALEKAGGTIIAETSYWTSSQFYYNDHIPSYVWYVGIDNLSSAYWIKNSNFSVCCIRAFN
ncbi:MAG: hypothetical protein J6X78_09290 [Treponema sp.]|nr:hypothetical protein [Treponema sp.]